MTTPARPSGWRCPQCGRRFLHRTREHSCDVRSVEMHLQHASAEVKSTFDKLKEILDGLGPHGVVAVKTMILLRGTANFGGIVVRRASLDLSFVTSRMQRHARIHKSEQVGPRKFAHHTRLASPAEVDAQIVSWLREAYQLGVRAEPN